MEHPITPPDELVQQWINIAEEDGLTAGHILAQAARWGADQELEACCAEVSWFTADKLRAARRPKPPSLKEQALAAHERSSFGIPGDRDLIRRALEQLND